MALSNITAKRGGTWCPYCKNKTEMKLYDYLKSKYINIKRQFKVDWCKNPKTKYFLPFDFCIESLKIILELDGPQHFKQISNWKSPKETQIGDHYKTEQAIKNGYTIIRLPQEDVWSDRKTYWKEELIKNLIHHKIPEQLYICENDEYSIYKNEYNIINN